MMMAAGFPLLSVLTFLPLLGVAAMLAMPVNSPDYRMRIRWVALVMSLVILTLSLGLWFGFDSASAAYQFEEQAAWLPGTGITYHMGVDGISVLFVMLTALITPIAILASWRTVENGVREYMVAMLLLESMLIGVFCAVDLLVFYVFFEAAMIPIFLIVGAWGGQRRAYAALKLFLYTMIGTLLMLLAVMTLWQMAGSTDLPTLMQLQISPRTQFWLFLAFFVAFAIKMPMWPVHTWQPEAYMQAPTAGSIMLGGVMLNMGAYGFVRFAIPLFPQASEQMKPYIFGLAVIAVIYASLVALAQKDMKKLVAYSSVAHMGVIAIGLFSVNQQSISGALMQMLSYGVISAALFLCIGVLSDRMGTQEVNRFGGVAKVMPLYAVIFMVFTMSSVALPGTSSFPGEFLVIVGAWKTSPWLSLGIATSMILGAAYMLWLYRRVLFGKITRDDVHGLVDLSPREMAMFAPLLVLTVWMGIYPTSFLDVFQVSVAALVEHREAALATAARLAGL